MLINKTNILKKFHNINSPRELFTDLSREYSCDKADSRLMEKYEGGYD